jgi:uncharacterized protein (TIGR04255 family)
MPSPYKKAPITEAIIDLRFATSVDVHQLEKLRDRLLEDYPLPIQQLASFGTQFTANALRIEQAFTGFQLTGADGDTIVVLGVDGITTSKLAPYRSWSDIFDPFTRNWQAFCKLVGRKDVTRVGIRFINRIDIPNEGRGRIDLSEYMAIGPRMEGELADLAGDYMMQVRCKSPEPNWELLLTTHVADPALVEHTSVVLDFDIFRTKEIPNSLQDLLSLVQAVQSLKNKIFESCITDKTRALFNQ